MSNNKPRVNNHSISNNDNIINKLVANKLLTVGVTNPPRTSTTPQLQPSPRSNGLRTESSTNTTNNNNKTDKKLPKLISSGSSNGSSNGLSSTASKTISDITTRINNIYQQNTKLQSTLQLNTLPTMNRLNGLRTGDKSTSSNELYSKSNNTRFNTSYQPEPGLPINYNNNNTNSIQSNITSNPPSNTSSYTPNGIRGAAPVRLKRASLRTGESISVPSSNIDDTVATHNDNDTARVNKITLKQALSLSAGTPLIVNGHEGRVMYIGTLSFLSGTVIGLKLSKSTTQNLPLVEQKHVSLSHFTQRDIKQSMRCDAEYAYYTRAHVSTFSIPLYKNAVTQRWIKVIAAVQCIVRLQYLNTVTLDKKMQFRRNQALAGSETDQRLSLTSFDPVELNRLKYYELDQFSTTVNKQKTYDVLSLAHVLTRNNTVSTQSDKIRVLYRWICDNINYHYDGNNKQYDILQSQIDKKYARHVQDNLQINTAIKSKASIQDVIRAANHSTAYDSDSDNECNSPSVANYEPSIVLKKRAADAYGYATLLNALCHAIGIECVTIHGISKEFNCELRIGDKLQMNHSWNAVYVSDNNQWAVVDCCLSSHYPIQAQPIHKTYDKVFSNAYYMCSTELFARNHLPLQVTTQSTNSKRCNELVQNVNKSQCLATGLIPFTLQQYSDSQWIYRNYIDYQVTSLISTDPFNQLIKCEQSQYTYSIQLPTNEEISVELTMPNSLNKSKQYIGQCYNVFYTVLHDNPYIHRADINYLFPVKGHYYAIVKTRHYNPNTNSYSSYEPLFHCRYNCTNGFNDVRLHDYDSVALGYATKLTLVGRDHSIEQYIQLIKPIRGYFELGSIQRFSLQCSIDVNKIVVVNNGHWVQLQPNGGIQYSINGRKSTQLYDAELALNRQYTDIQIYYQLHNHSQYNLIYSFNTDQQTIPSAFSTTHHNEPLVRSTVKPVRSAGQAKSPSKVAFQLDDDEINLNDSIESVDSVTDQLTDTTIKPSSHTPIDNKHMKIVLDSRGICFEKLINVIDVKSGKRSVVIRVSVGSDNTTLRGEIRSNWTSGIKINDINAVKIRALTVGQYEIQCSVQHTGEYVIHCFACTNGTQVNRFAFMLFVRL